MTIAAIVQARMGSSRLPGKVMLDLGGKTVLQHVLDRCRAIPSVDVVVCAVPDEPQSAPAEEVARSCGSTVFLGSERDVLARYLGAARAVSADIVLRVTSDCPLIDPEICDEVIALQKDTDADYATNNMPPSFPHGIDCEAFKVAALARAADEAKLPDEREHVTPWLRQSPHFKRENLSSGDPALTAYRWTLDYPEDMQFFRALFEAMPGAGNARMREIVAFLERRPEIAEINASLKRPFLKPTT